MAHRTRSGTHSHGWGWPMAIGILLVVGGVFALLATVLTSYISIIYFGTMLIVAAVLEIIAAFRLRETGPVLAYVLAGILTGVVGCLFIAEPFAGLASVTLLLAGYLFAGGLFRGIMAISDRHDGWGWDVAYGLLTIALGVYTVAYWPIDSLWIVGTIVALEIIARGITLIAAAWVVRDVEHAIPQAA